MTWEEAFAAAFKAARDTGEKHHVFATRADDRRQGQVVWHAADDEPEPWLEYVSEYCRD